MRANTQGKWRGASTARTCSTFTPCCCGSGADGTLSRNACGLVAAPRRPADPRFGMLCPAKVPCLGEPRATLPCFGDTAPSWKWKPQEHRPKQPVRCGTVQPVFLHCFNCNLSSKADAVQVTSGRQACMFTSSVRRQMRRTEQLSPERLGRARRDHRTPAGRPHL